MVGHALMEHGTHVTARPRLHAGVFGGAVRLEQERIDWNHAITHLRTVLAD